MTADYTPNTDKVRDAYIRGMRTAFIASAGEHHEEFDRWLAAHDAQVAAQIAEKIRASCTVPSEVAISGGDAIVYAVADWIENPPEWAKAPWSTVFPAPTEEPK
jgi:hypothetical protein